MNSGILDGNIVITDLSILHYFLHSMTDDGQLTEMFGPPTFCRLLLNRLKCLTSAVTLEQCYII